MVINSPLMVIDDNGLSIESQSMVIDSLGMVIDDNGLRLDSQSIIIDDYEESIDTAASSTVSYAYLVNYNCS
jgi:hypothetical protein